MIGPFFYLLFALVGVCIIVAVKIWSFVLWRVVPVVGFLYLCMAVAEAHENPYDQFYPHTLVVITVNDMEEQATYESRKQCIKRGRLLSGDVREDYIGFVCEVVLPEKVSAVCHEEVKHCA